MIYVSDHIQQIISIIGKYGIQPDWLEVTDSMQNWCSEHGVEESNPFRAAKCFLLPERCHIVMRNEQTDEMIQSAKQYMELDGFESEVSMLDTDFKYLMHLVLHEVACHVLKLTDQKSRDEWAFKELYQYVS